LRDAVDNEIVPLNVERSPTSNVTLPFTSLVNPLISSNGVVLKNVAWFLPYLSLKEKFCSPEANTLKPCAKDTEAYKAISVKVFNIVFITVSPFYL